MVRSSRITWWLVLLALGWLSGWPQRLTATLPDWVFEPQYWWQTPDQAGLEHYRAGRYRHAVRHFNNSGWRGAACYRAGDYECAAQAFSKLAAATGSELNLGNTAAQQQQPEIAIAHYDAALRMQPGWLSAEENRALMRIAIATHDRDQRNKPETGEPTEDPDGTVIDDRAKKGKPGAINIEKLDPGAVDKLWLRNVRTDPGEFLRLRFAAEAQAAANSYKTAP
jgi:Ca-activated chloride channel family protein